MNNISIIIPTYNNVQLLEDCLFSLNKHVSVKEIIIVDNGSNEISLPLLNQDVVYLRVPANRGFSAACNLGAKIASTNNYLFLNNDTICKDDFVTPMLKALKTGVGVVGCKLVFPDGSIQHAGVGLAMDQYEKLHGYEIREERPSGFVGAVTGACMLVRGNAFRDVGGFDEGYWNGNEDVDLCMKMQKSNWKVYYEADSVVTHLLSQSGPERFSKVHRNVERFNQKWNPA